MVTREVHISHSSNKQRCIYTLLKTSSCGVSQVRRGQIDRKRRDNTKTKGLNWDYDSTPPQGTAAPEVPPGRSEILSRVEFKGKWPGAGPLGITGLETRDQDVRPDRWSRSAG